MPRHSNFHKTREYIKKIYEEVKHHDVPDTFIVAREFPKHNIFISRRTWVRIKAGDKPKDNQPSNQLSIFGDNNL